MATFSQLERVAQDSGFQLRVKIGLLQTALAVYNEATTITGHGVRATFATKVLDGTGYDLFAVALMVVSSNNMPAALSLMTLPDFGIADTDIQNALSAAWNALAGV